MTQRVVHPYNSLTVRSQLALRLSHAKFGELLGVSGRTSERWSAGDSAPQPTQLATMAHHVYRADKQLAAEIAAAIDMSLQELGIVAPAPAPAPVKPAVPATDLVDLVVCTAAETMDVSPRLMRPVLHAAFARARKLGLDMAAVEAALAPAAAPSRAAQRKDAKHSAT